MSRLRERFNEVQKHVLVALAVPKGGGLFRHAVAPLVAPIMAVNPYHAASPEELLLRSAQRHLQEDDLVSALHDVSQLTGTDGVPKDTTFFRWANSI